MLQNGWLGGGETNGPVFNTKSLTYVRSVREERDRGTSPTSRLLPSTREARFDRTESEDGMVPEKLLEKTPRYLSEAIEKKNLHIQFSSIQSKALQQAAAGGNTA
jgi:hypothetical protein